MTNVPPILHGIAFVAALWLVALSVGRGVVRALRLPLGRFSALERGLICMLSGAGALQLVPYALSAFGCMSPQGVRYAMLAVAVLSLPGVIASLRSIPERSTQRWALPLRLWGCALALLLAVLFVHALVIGNLGDDDGYHLSAPARWLREGSLSYLPTYTHTNAAFGFEMLYVIALSFGESIGAKLLHFSAGLWTLLTIAACARRLNDWLAGILSISALMIVTPLVNLPYVFSQAYVDFAACWAAMMSVLVWLVFREQRDRALLSALALCAGLTGSFKFTALSVVVAWAAILVLDLWLAGDRLAAIALRLLRFGAIASIPVLPWLYRNWSITGNPVYPTLASLIPTRDWSAEHAATFSRYIRYYSWGVASGGRWNDGVRQGLSIGAGAVVVGGALLLQRFTRNATVKILVAFGALNIVLCIGLTGLVFRYWLPGLACLTLSLFVIAGQKLSDARKHILALALISCALLAQLRVERTREPGFLSDLRVGLGLRTAQAEHANDPRWQMWEFIKSSTPRDAKILVAAFYTTYGASSFGGFPLERTCFTTDSHLQAYIRLNTWDEFLASVKAAHIDYLLVADEQCCPDRIGFEFAAQRNEFPFCKRLGAEYGEQVARFEHLNLYRLHVR
jgi:hypothetical protein